MVWLSLDWTLFCKLSSRQLFYSLAIGLHAGAAALGSQKRRREGNVLGATWTAHERRLRHGDAPPNAAADR